MRAVYKFECDTGGDFNLQMPVDAEILDCQWQGDPMQGHPHIWALVETDNDVEIRRFLLVGTGHPIAPHQKLKFVGTFQCHGGTLVFHLFEVKNDH